MSRFEQAKAELERVLVGPPRARSRQLELVAAPARYGAISVMQPWAWLIAHAREWPAHVLGKTIENRKRPTNYRGPVLIHVSRRWEKVRERLAELRRVGLVGGVCPEPRLAEMRGQLGQVIAVGELVGCRRVGSWDPHPWGIAESPGPAHPRRVARTARGGALRRAVGAVGPVEAPRRTPARPGERVVLMSMYSDRRFGRLVRSLRKARGLTQEGLGKRCELSVDTIRRCEHGSFSPSLGTLRKLVGGLNMLLSTLFSVLELNERSVRREFLDLIEGRSDKEVELVFRVVWALLEELDELAAEELERLKQAAAEGPDEGSEGGDEPDEI